MGNDKQTNLTTLLILSGILVFTLCSTRGASSLAIQWDDFWACSEVKRCRKFQIEIHFLERCSNLQRENLNYVPSRPLSSPLQTQLEEKGVGPLACSFDEF